MPITGTYIDEVFAASGTVTTVPDAVQSDGSVSFTQGYGANYTLPQSNPSCLNVELGKMNYLFNLITTILQQYQQQTVAPWITHAQNGGSAFSYAKNALVLYTDGNIYQSLVATNTTDPTNDGINWTILNAPFGKRIKLGANINFYVSTTGNDSTGNGTSGSPWATLQKAANYVQTNYDLNGYTVTVNVASGTYAGVTVNGAFVGATASNSFQFLGNTTTPTNVIISTSTADCFKADFGAVFAVAGFQVTCSGGHNGIYADHNSGIIINGNMNFASCGGNHVASSDGSWTGFATGSGAAGSSGISYTISGGAASHVAAWENGRAYVANCTVTLSGTPAFSTAFAYAFSCGVIPCGGDTFSGSATGSRYYATANGVINSAGGGSSYLPGNSAGTTATGGQAV